MEQALKKFINIWRKNKNVTGILLTGSYSIGLQSKNSDIDIRIILNSEVKESFKGLQEIDGYLFSYLGRTKKAISNKFNSDYFNNSKLEARMFNVGKIIYSTNEDLSELKNIAKHYYNQPFLEKAISKDDKKSMMYNLYNLYNYLIETDSKSPFFLFNYMIFMKQALSYYFHISNIEMVMDSKLERLLTDKKYISKYNFKISEKYFITLWLRNISPSNINKESLNEIYSYMENKLSRIDKKKLIIFWKE